MCHRDMSLENIVVDEYTRSIVIDLGMCLRVPFHDETTGEVTDVRNGSIRRLICNQNACGKLWYMSPEVLKNKEPFDGFAVDLWGAAVILFIMLVGKPLWEFASEEHESYRLVTRSKMPSGPVKHLDQCGVGLLIQQMGREVSPSAADLLQRMLREDPRQRMSLADVQEHPWINDEDAQEASVEEPNEGWRNTMDVTD